MQLVDPDELVEVNGQRMKIRDVPDQNMRAFIGMGHQVWDLEHREVHQGGWPYAPEDCLTASSTKGEWINGGENLVCRGCGMDFT